MTRRVDFDRNDGVTGDTYVADGCQHYVQLANSAHHVVLNGTQYRLEGDKVLLGYFNSDGYIDVFQRRSNEVWRVAYAFTFDWVDIQNSEREFSKLSVCDANGDGLDDIYVASRREYSASSGTDQRWSGWTDGTCGA